MESRFSGCVSALRSLRKHRREYEEKQGRHSASECTIGLVSTCHGANGRPRKKARKRAKKKQSDHQMLRIEEPVQFKDGKQLTLDTSESAQNQLVQALPTAIRNCVGALCDWWRLDCRSVGFQGLEFVVARGASCEASCSMQSAYS